MTALNPHAPVGHLKVTEQVVGQQMRRKTASRGALSESDLSQRVVDGAALHRPGCELRSQFVSTSIDQDAIGVKARGVDNFVASRAAFACRGQNQIAEVIRECDCNLRSSPS